MLDAVSAVPVCLGYAWYFQDIPSGNSGAYGTSPFITGRGNDLVQDHTGTELSSWYV